MRTSIARRLPDLLFALVVGVTLALIVVTSQSSFAVLANEVERSRTIDRMRSDALTSHLWLEERLAGDVSIDVQTQIRQPLLRAVAECPTQDGDSGAVAGSADPSTDFTAAIGPPCQALQRLRLLSDIRIQTGDGAAGSSLDSAYDAAFATFIARLSVAENLAQGRYASTVTGARWLNLLATGVAGVLLAFLGIATNRKRRTMHKHAGVLKHQSLHDPLTGLANRVMLRQRLVELLEPRGTAIGQVGVIFLDLDRFKEVNDNGGHELGDRILIATASRLQNAVRDDDLVVRLGGDEFAVVCAANRGTVEPFVDVAMRIQDAFHTPFVVDGRAHHISASMGVASGIPGETDRADIMRAADMAMYAAKADGRGRIERFTHQLYVDAMARHELADDLRTAIEDGQLRVHYQPVISLEDGSIVKVEALVRWEHPQRGLVPPDEFIGIAEERGLIDALGEWVLLEACQQVRTWQTTMPQHHRLGVAVNVSAVQWAGQHLLSAVDAALRTSGLRAEDLTLEITETDLMNHSLEAADAMQLLSARGVRLSMDDFGTGYSSLSRLRDFAIDELKIDRSFINEINDGRGNLPLITTILAMAANLGMPVVAEGIETTHQLQFLAHRSCQLGQGYHFSRPLPAVDLTAYLQQTSSRERVTSLPPPTSERSDLANMLTEVTKADQSTQTAITAVLRLLREVTGMEAVYLTRIDWDGDRQIIHSSIDSTALPIPAGTVVDWSDTVCRAMLEGAPRHTDDVPQTYPASTAARTLGMQSYAGVPIIVGEDQIFGTLCAADSAARSIPDDVLMTMEFLALLIATRLDDKTKEPEPNQSLARIDR